MHAVDEGHALDPIKEQGPTEAARVVDVYRAAQLEFAQLGQCVFESAVAEVGGVLSLASKQHVHGAARQDTRSRWHASPRYCGACNSRARLAMPHASAPACTSALKSVATHIGVRPAATQARQDAHQRCRVGQNKPQICGAVDLQVLEVIEVGEG